MSITGGKSTDKESDANVLLDRLKSVKTLAQNNLLAARNLDDKLFGQRDTEGSPEEASPPCCGLFSRINEDISDIIDLLEKTSNTLDKVNHRCHN